MQLIKFIVLLTFITNCSLNTFCKNRLIIKEIKINKNSYNCKININNQIFNLSSEKCQDSNFPNHPSYLYHSTPVNNKDSIVINFETLGAMNGVNFNVIFIKSNNIYNLKYITIEELFYPFHNNSIFYYPNKVTNINLSNLSNNYLQYNYIHIPKSNLKILKVDTTYEILYDINNSKSNIIFYNPSLKKCIVVTIPYKIVDLVVIQDPFKLIASINKKEISLNINFNKNGTLVLPKYTFDSNENNVHNLSIKSNKYIYKSSTNQFQISVVEYENIDMPHKLLQSRLPSF
jgi:hypothetical protein